MAPKSLLGSLACLALAVALTGGCQRLSGATQPTQPPTTRSSVVTAPASTPGGLSTVTTYHIQPTATASGLSGPSAPDFVAVDRGVSSNGELFLFLPGTGGQPECCQDLLETAAETGFLAIGLTYPNTEAVGKICLNDLSCYGIVRQNDFDGSAPSTFSDITPANSIQSRLVDLLLYLAARHPRQGWGQFLDGPTPVWSRIVVAGHSQGGGDAAYVAKIRRVEGVVMLSSPVDSSATDPPVPATYLTTGHLTPLERYVAFDHVDDPFHDKIVADWTALDLQSFGPAASVDGSRPPFRQLPRARDLCRRAPGSGPGARHPRLDSGRRPDAALCQRNSGLRARVALHDAGGGGLSGHLRAAAVRGRLRSAASASASLGRAGPRSGLGEDQEIEAQRRPGMHPARCRHRWRPAPPRTRRRSTAPEWSRFVACRPPGHGRRAWWPTPAP